MNKLKRIKSEKAITLVALIITIVVLLILAIVAINEVQGEGILTYAKKSTFLSEIGEIKEQITLKELPEPDKQKYKFGTLADIIGRTDEYNEMLYVENGKLVYVDEKVTEQQISWLNDIGITVRQNIIPIYTAEQFSKISSNENIEVNGITYKFAKNATYYIQNDIDFKGSAETPNTTISSFSGKLDGQNYTFSNIYISGSGAEGLFAENSGIIQNIKLKDTYVKTTSMFAGTIAANNAGEVRNISMNNVKVSGANGVYGLLVGVNDRWGKNGKIIKCLVEEYTINSEAPMVGGNNGTIESCYSRLIYGSGNPTDMGAIVFQNGGTIKDCGFEGEIKGYLYCAGIAMSNGENGKIINCYNKGNITARHHGASGIALTNKGMIINCYNKGNVKWGGFGISSDNSGLIIGGYNVGSADSAGICGTNTGKIISSYNVGQDGGAGFLSKNTGTILGCYNKTSKNYFMSAANEGTLTNSYYYDNTNMVMCDETGTAITMTKMEDFRLLLENAYKDYIAVNGDIDGEDYSVTWIIDEKQNGGYPILSR